MLLVLVSFPPLSLQFLINQGDKILTVLFMVSRIHLHFYFPSSFFSSSSVAFLFICLFVFFYRGSDDSAVLFRVGKCLLSVLSYLSCNCLTPFSLVSALLSSFTSLSGLFWSFTLQLILLFLSRSYSYFLSFILFGDFGLLSFFWFILNFVVFFGHSGLFWYFFLSILVFLVFFQVQFDFCPASFCLSILHYFCLKVTFFFSCLVSFLPPSFQCGFLFSA